jgi:septation ring formation regulator EzrA
MVAEKTNILKETNIMDSTQDRCRHLSRLRTNLYIELNELKEGLNQEEREGVANPIETVNIIKSLQKTLQNIEVELEKCPPDV